MVQQAPPADHVRGHPVKNVSKTPIAAGQWEREAPGQPLRMVIKAQGGWNEVPKTGTLTLFS